MDLNISIQECPLVFVDLETTGLLAERSSICEVAAIKVQNGKIIDKFHTLVRPHHKIPYAAFCIHNISDHDLIGAPYFEEMAGQLDDFLRKGVVCAYNVDFDLSFINHHFQKNQLKPLDVSSLDILAMARSAVELKSYRLESVARFFGLPADTQFHRAQSDVYATYLIFLKLTEIIMEKKKVFAAKEFIKLYGQF